MASPTFEGYVQVMHALTKRKRERETDRQTDRQRDRDREKEKEKGRFEANARKRGYNPFTCL